MQVGVTQMILGDLSCEEFLCTAAETGYEVVELCLSREGALTPSISDAAVGAIVAQARTAGVDLVSMTMSHCTGNLLDTGEARERSIAETVAGLELAARLGIRCVLHTLGSLRPDLYYADAYDNGIASLKELAPHAERLGVTIAFEFVWNGFLFSPVEVRRFLDEVGSSHVGFYFDPGNMAVFQFPQHWVRAIGHHVKVAHMKDWRGGAQNGDWTPLLEGEVDFGAVVGELRAIGYDGPMISETPPDMASLEATAEAIRRIIAL